MMNHQAVAVSDGSHKKETNTATSAFLIEGVNQEKHQTMGVNRILGRVASLSSFGAKSRALWV